MITDSEQAKKKVLFVRSGGGLPGLDIHVGIWQALDELGIKADACHGTSAGAIISAFDAYEHSVSEIRQLICGLSEEDVLDYRRLWMLRVPFINSFIQPDKIHALLDRELDYGFACRKELVTWSTNARTGYGTNTFRPELAQTPAQAVIASMSISGVFPPTKLLDGDDYTDGGVSANLPVPPVALLKEYDHVYLLIATGDDAKYNEDNSLLTQLLQNVAWLQEDQRNDTIDHTFTALGYAKVTVIKPELSTPGMLHFDHRLIEEAYAWTKKQLGGL